jgi:hypothetical protein
MSLLGNFGPPEDKKIISGKHRENSLSTLLIGIARKALYASLRALDHALGPTTHPHAWQALREQYNPT